MAEAPSTRPVFYAEYFAPWCEKARWSLDHHGIDYEYREHAPLLGEVTLRLAARSLRRRVTVPLLIADGVALGESLDICAYAERHGRGPPLVPPGAEREIREWNRRSDALMRAGRVGLFERLARMPDALAEWPVPFAGLAPSLRRPVARAGVSFLARKYRAVASTAAEAEAVLVELRTALATRPDHLLLGTLTLADIAMATALQFVRPVDDSFMRLPPAVREAWTDRATAERFGDLLAWRDALYARSRHRCGDAPDASRRGGHGAVAGRTGTRGASSSS